MVKKMQQRTMIYLEEIRNKSMVILKGLNNNDIHIYLKVI